MWAHTLWFRLPILYVGSDLDQKKYYCSFLMQEQYLTAMQRKETQKRRSIVSALSDLQKKDVFKRGLELLEEQDRHLDHIDTLPSLQLSGTYHTVR